MIFAHITDHEVPTLVAVITVGIALGTSLGAALYTRFFRRGRG